MLHSKAGEFQIRQNRGYMLDILPPISIVSAYWKRGFRSVEAAHPQFGNIGSAVRVEKKCVFHIQFVKVFHGGLAS